MQLIDDNYDDGEMVAVELRINSDRPIPLRQLSEAFVGLDEMFQSRLKERYPEMKGYLAIRRVAEGSQIYELVAVAGAAMMPFAAVAFDAMVKTVAVADFADRLIKGSRWLMNVFDKDTEPSEPLSKSELDSINGLLKTVVGRRGASLNIRKLRVNVKSGKTEVDLQLDMGQDDLNAAAITTDRILKELPPPPDAEADGIRQFNEVILELEQANVGPGKEAGRTGDKGVIREISPKACPVYFRTAIQELKEQMIRGDDNPFEMLYVVSVSATMRKGEPIAYTVTDIHTKMPR